MARLKVFWHQPFGSNFFTWLEVSSAFRGLNTNAVGIYFKLTVILLGFGIEIWCQEADRDFFRRRGIVEASYMAE